MQKKVEERFKTCTEKGMEMHPMIFVKEADDKSVEPDEFIVTFHQTQYRFKYLLEAVDICFKIFLVFNIPFPLESRQFYVLLNELFYKTSSDIKKSSKVMSLIQKLQ